MKKVKDIMTQDVDTCSLLDNVYEVALKMKQLDVGAIPIIDNGKIIGLITDRDLVVRGIAEKRPGSTKVEEVMTDHLITIHEEESIYQAGKLMAEHQIRRLPVVDGDKLVGMVSLGDIAVDEQSDYQAKNALTEISEDRDQSIMN